MVMVLLPPERLNHLGRFRNVLSKPQFENFRSVIFGLIISGYKEHDVKSMRDTVGETKCQSSINRFFTSPCWKLDDGMKCAQLQEAKNTQNSAIDSPIFQLIEGFPDIERIKTDVFRDRVQYSSQLKDQIAIARRQGRETLAKLERQTGGINNLESGVVIDLFLSYRAVQGWPEMINLAMKMSPDLANTVMVQEQLGLALSRVGKGEEAEKVLLDLIEKRGPSSETYGILGRVYKDRWEGAYKRGDELLAQALLDQAIDAYLHGFDADLRDAYPGLNAVTLIEIREPPDSSRIKLILD
jgi:tetratricopeptide (TPR) repeat protein